MPAARLAGDPAQRPSTGPGPRQSETSVIPAEGSLEEGGLDGATRLLPAGARLLAAVSGGPDSSALLVWLAEIAEYSSASM